MVRLERRRGSQKYTVFPRPAGIDFRPLWRTRHKRRHESDIGNGRTAWRRCSTARRGGKSRAGRPAQTLRGGGQILKVLLEHFDDGVLRGSALYLFLDLTSVEQKQGGDSSDVVAARDRLVLVDVYFAKLGAPRPLPSNGGARPGPPPAPAA